MSWEAGILEWGSIEEYYEAAKNHWAQCLYLPTGPIRTDEVTLTDSELVSQIDGTANNGIRKSGVHIAGVTDFGKIDVLDFGCGVGIDAIGMLESGAHVTLCDIVQSNLDVATRQLNARNLTNFETFLIEGLDSLKELGKYDIIYAMGSLQTIPREYAKMIVSELKEHLRPGGKILAMTYVGDGGFSVSGEGPYVCGYSADELKELFGTDMKVIKNERYNADCFQMTTVVHRKKRRRRF